jgi:hypothetical protein
MYKTVKIGLKPVDNGAVPKSGKIGLGILKSDMVTEG